MKEKGSRAIIALGEIDSVVTEFVDKNLAEQNIAVAVAGSTDDFVLLSESIPTNRILVLDPDWDLVLEDHCQKKPDTKIFAVRWKNSNWSVVRETTGFNVTDPRIDGPLFQRHVLAFLKE